MNVLLDYCLVSNIFENLFFFRNVKIICLLIKKFYEIFLAF
ncbi:hypothetical protein Halhy_6055 [Haliscomenobacter hydrossis DSM 1100]|uniref:Uncharacterized protein n=1 Tax=Haliscomenobacter hydrossis (strain ATCC 27775 / DSM 1100 / LMG 10767 / O) TaxID=760192 RepID=F4L2G0_HALH1|nr:hypothetical protein Halhy_6055 [Haliscomenobacter hydrossis DSM 1100]